MTADDRPAGALLLTAAEVAYLDRALCRLLVERSTVDGGPPAELQRLVALVHQAARNQRDQRRARSTPGAEPGASPAGGGVSSSRQPESRLTTREAACLLQVSESYVRRLCRTGELAARRGPRGAWEIEPRDIVARAATRPGWAA